MTAMTTELDVTLDHARLMNAILGVATRARRRHEGLVPMIEAEAAVLSREGARAVENLTGIVKITVVRGIDHAVGAREVESTTVVYRHTLVRMRPRPKNEREAEAPISLGIPIYMKKTDEELLLLNISARVPLLHLHGVALLRPLVSNNLVATPPPRTSELRALQQCRRTHPR